MDLSKKRVQENGITTRIVRDELGRPIKGVMRSTIEDKVVERYTYDSCENGEMRLCKVVSNGEVTKYSYTLEGLVSKVTVRSKSQNFSEVTKYSYTESGNVNRIIYPSGLIISYIYKDGLVTKITAKTRDQKTSRVIAKNISFDPQTQALINLKLGNGLTQKRFVDVLANTDNVTIKGAGREVSDRTYYRDDFGRVDSIYSKTGNVTQSYEYDPAGRLKREESSTGIIPDTTKSYEYDAAFNRVERKTVFSDGSSKRQRLDYDSNSNQIAMANKNSFSFDSNGNLVEDRSGKRRFDYDVNNRMSAFFKNDQLRATYKYNYRGQRTEKVLYRSRASSDEGGWKLWRANYSLNGHRLGEIGYKPDANGDYQRVFSRDIIWLGDMPIAQVERRFKKSSDSSTHENFIFIHTDHTGAPFIATGDNKNVVWRWDRDAFGKGGVDRDPDADGIKTRMPLRFPGQVYDQESGLFYNNMRDYDPNLGRYIQSDPIGLIGGINRNAYVLADPVNVIDPSGLGGCSWRDASTTITCQKDGKGEGGRGYNGASYTSYDSGGGGEYGAEYNPPEQESDEAEDEEECEQNTECDGVTTAAAQDTSTTHVPPLNLGGYNLPVVPTNPDGSINRGATCEQIQTPTGTVTIPPGYSPYVRPDGTNSPLFMRDPSGNVVPTPEMRRDTATGAQRFADRNENFALFGGLSSTLFGFGSAGYSLATANTSAATGTANSYLTAGGLFFGFAGLGILTADTMVGAAENATENANDAIEQEPYNCSIIRD